MELKFLNKKLQISLFSVVIFAFFLLVSIVSLSMVRQKILENSHIMGEEIAARFATKETARIKSQEMLLRSVAQSMGSMLDMDSDLQDEKLEQTLQRFTEYMENNTEIGRFDMCAVINGRLIGKSWEKDVPIESLKWYRSALNQKGQVTYSNLYRKGNNKEYSLTMAVSMGQGDNVLAINLYPQKLNSLLADNRLPAQSYYYLCDPNGNIMYAINDRNMTIDDQQPYVDQIFSEIRSGANGYIIDLEGNKRGVYYAVSDKGWISIVTIPYDFLLGDYRSLLKWFILTLAIFCALTVALTMREHILNKQVQVFEEVTQVMSKSYLAAFRVNLATGEYVTLKCENLEFEAPAKGDYTELLSRMVECVETEAATEFAETFSLANMQKLVWQQQIHEFGGEFRQRFGKEYKWVNVRMVQDELLGKDDAIFFLRDVEAEKLRELDRMRVTERALKVARENTKSRNMFFSAMSHDMRAPLNGIIGMAELAEMHQGDHALVADYIQKIKSSGKQLLTLINDILEMARLDNGKVEHLQETFSMTEISKEIGGIYAAQAELENKYFQLEVLPDQKYVNGDLQGLRQILNNVLSNAVKYTPSGGKITFTVRRESAGKGKRPVYAFIVQDTGCGMSEKFLEKIYTPFERDSRFGVPHVVGTGLGMTIVKSLVERMEGTIHISSKVDEGTCVLISLPFQEVEKVPAPRPAAKLSDFADCTVLVADDNDISMEIITELLTMNKLKVITAANGQEAVERFAASAEGSVDMVLMDMQMPVLDGCGASKAIRALERKDAASVPIVALTGNSASSDVEAAMQAGMNNYMVKPVQMKLLAKMLEEYIRR
ncbi:ATP-binding protein [Phascolarctobacterium sp.]|uniref:hybrid sensor histidine kinase/response regulator n=1 Tax=Phascolarctobacterium sp. TaxID=2049039 RepID=UPI003867D9A7